MSNQHDQSFAPLLTVNVGSVPAQCPVGCPCGGQSNLEPYTKWGFNTPETLIEDDEDDEMSISTDDESDEEEDEVDEEGLDWADDPTKLGELEELRWWFGTELKDPSAWTLHRIKSLTQSKRTFAAREIVQKWLLFVATSTQITAEGELLLPFIGQAGDGMPFHRALTWEEFEARGYFPWRDIDESYKRDARLTITFLFPEAETVGLSTEEKKRMFKVASRLWKVHSLKAEALLWVLREEYAYTRKDEGGEVREWPNFMAEQFMTYTALYPPPIAT